MRKNSVGSFFGLKKFVFIMKLQILQYKITEIRITNKLQNIEFKYSILKFLKFLIILIKISF